MAQYEDAVIPLHSICEKYFGYSIRTAMNKAKLGLLPIPVFKLVESAKAPYYIHVTDLATYIDDLRAIAQRELQLVSNFS